MRNSLFYSLLTSILVSCFQVNEPEPISYIQPCDFEEMGVGVLFVNQTTNNYTDSMVIYSNSLSDTLGYLVKSGQRIAMGDSVFRGALFEFTYEYLGLPLLEIKGDWAKVLLYQQDERQQSGWISLQDKLIKYEMWGDYLARRVHFFRRCYDPKFYNAVNGELVGFYLEYSLDERTGISWPNYHFYPIESQDGWMRVQVDSPSQYCVSDTAYHRSANLWIKYIDDIGRPNVWFYTRGC